MLVTVSSGAQYSFSESIADRLIRLGDDVGCSSGYGAELSLLSLKNFKRIKESYITSVQGSLHAVIRKNLIKSAASSPRGCTQYLNFLRCFYFMNLCDCPLREDQDTETIR